MGARLQNDACAARLRCERRVDGGPYRDVRDVQRAAEQLRHPDSAENVLLLHEVRPGVRVRLQVLPAGLLHLCREQLHEGVVFGVDHAEGVVAKVPDALHACIEHAVVRGDDAYRVPRCVAAHVVLERLDIEPLGEAGDVLRLLHPAHDEVERCVDERPFRGQFDALRDVLVAHAVGAQVLQEGGDAPGSRALRLRDDVLLVGGPSSQVDVRVEQSGEHVLSAAVDHLFSR